MLTGGEKAKIKNIIIAIKGEYPKVLEVLKDSKSSSSQKGIDQLFDCNKKIFMWMAHIPTTIINSNAVLSESFDALQESNRFSSISSKESKKVKLLMDSVDKIPSLQEELIRIISDDTSQRERILKDIMDELGIEDPNKKKKTSNKKFNSMSFEDWFNDD